MSKDLTAAWDALTREAAGQTSRVDKALPAAAAAQPIPARSGTGKPAAASGNGSAIASPLTETAFADRTWWSSRNKTSTDGLFTLAHTPLKSIKFTGANSAEVVINFVDPPVT